MQAESYYADNDNSDKYDEERDNESLLLRFFHTFYYLTLQPDLIGIINSYSE
jgi:hypothetical protein